MVIIMIISIIMFITTIIIIMITEMSWCGGRLVVERSDEEKMRRMEERIEEVERLSLDFFYEILPL